MTIHSAQLINGKSVKIIEISGTIALLENGSVTKTFTFISDEQYYAAIKTAFNILRVMLGLSVDE